MPSPLSLDTAQSLQGSKHVWSASLTLSYIYWLLMATKARLFFIGLAIPPSGHCSAQLQCSNSACDIDKVTGQQLSTHKEGAKSDGSIRRQRYHKAKASSAGRTHKLTKENIFKHCTQHFVLNFKWGITYTSLQYGCESFVQPRMSRQVIYMNKPSLQSVRFSFYVAFPTVANTASGGTLL